MDISGNGRDDGSGDNQSHSENKIHMNLFLCVGAGNHLPGFYLRRYAQFATTVARAVRLSYRKRHPPRRLNLFDDRLDHDSLAKNA
jgi:hypothetical protein